MRCRVLGKVEERELKTAQPMDRDIQEIMQGVQEAGDMLLKERSGEILVRATPMKTICRSEISRAKGPVFPEKGEIPKMVKGLDPQTSI